MDIKKLYFGVYQWDFNQKKPREVNLFDSLRVMRSIAIWKTIPDDQKNQISDPLSFCFGDTWGRVEWEFDISAPFFDDNHYKMDIFTLYVKPNAQILLDMVEKVSVESAKRWLDTYQKIYRNPKSRDIIE